MGLGRLRWKLLWECELCSGASVWVNIMDWFEKSFRREQYSSQKNSIGELIPRFIHDTFKNYCYFKLVWTWKLFTVYFLCPPGWNLGTFWLDSWKYLIICLTLNTCLHPIWMKVKPVLKCFAGSNIPHLAGSHILQDRPLSDTRLKEKEPFFILSKAKCPFRWLYMLLPCSCVCVKH